jgi:hypothetical protein
MPFGYKDIPLEQVVTNPYTASPQEIHDGIVLYRVNDHFQEALEHFPREQIVGCFLQGSQNYGLDYEGSDVDTKLIVVPSFKDICLNHKPVSTTHVRANDEHTDWKDVRLYMDTFRSQNLNFLEILFTDYFIVNPLYEDLWAAIVRIREEIARVNPLNAIKAMMGMVSEKEHALEHRYPSRAAWIDKYGYDPKQLSHLIRIAYFAYGYMNGPFTYADLVKGESMLPSHKEKLVEIKRQGCGELSVARKIADTHVAMTKAIYEAAKKKYDGADNEDIKTEMFSVMREMVERGLRRELAQA